MTKLELVHIAELDSTNDYLTKRSKEKEFPSGTVLYTDYQTKGKGQTGNSWHSEKGKNLLFSLYVKPNNLQLKDYFVITEIITIAIKETLSKLAEGITIKWPNDIYWKNKKLGGILIENSICQSHITSTTIGVGLNVNQEYFDESLPNPISLYNITKQQYNCLDILKAISQKTMFLFESYDRDNIHNKYLDSLFRINEKYFYIDTKTNEKFLATIQTVNKQGQLLLQTEDKEMKKYYFKEVEYLI